MKCLILSKLFTTIDELDKQRKIVSSKIGKPDLTCSELIFINAVFENPNSNAVELSKELMVTRGAITQWGNSLEKKNLVSRFLKDSNKKEKYYTLTPKGIEVVNSYRDYHKSGNHEICKYFSNLSDEQRTTIMDFLDHISVLEVCEFDCMHSNECMADLL